MFSYKVKKESLVNLKLFLHRLNIPAEEAYDFVQLLSALEVPEESEQEEFVVTLDKEAILKLESYLKEVVLKGIEIYAFHDVMMSFSAESRVKEENEEAISDSV